MTAKTERAPLSRIIYGKPISDADADVMYDRHRRIRKRSRQKILNALQGDPEAIRFYLGREFQGRLFEDSFYVFTTEAIEQILERLRKKEADGIIVYKGARAATDSIDEAGRRIDVDGRPTLIIFPYREKKGSDGSFDSIILERLCGDGTEHPGTGGDDDDDGEPLVRIPEEHPVLDIIKLLQY